MSYPHYDRTLSYWQCKGCKLFVPNGHFFKMFSGMLGDREEWCFDCRPFINEIDCVYQATSIAGIPHPRPETLPHYNVFIAEKRKQRKDEIVTSLDGLVIAPLATIIASFDY